MLYNLPAFQGGLFMRWFLGLLALGVTGAVQAKPFTADIMVGLNRVSAPAVSPDGKSMLFVMRETDREANKGRTDIFKLDVVTAGAKPQRLAADPANDSNAQWSADGKQIYFLSGRSKSSQIWRMNADGTGLVQVTKSPVDISGFHLSPAGDRVAFWADVFPDCATLACSADRLAQKKQATGKVYDKLFVRHWDTWKNGTRSQLFTVGLAAPDVEPINITRGLDGDTPSKPMGEGDEITFSPDGKTLYFALREAGRSEAWSTNLDIFSAPADGSAAPKNLTPDMDGQDSVPVVSPDGKKLAWLSMARPKFEADKQRVMILELSSGKTQYVTQNWDRSVSAMDFTPDGKSLIAVAQNVGKTNLFRIDTRKGEAAQLTTSGTVGEFVLHGTNIYFTRHNLKSPADIYRIPQEGGGSEQLTSVNADMLADVQMGDAEQMKFKGWKEEDVYAWIVKPINFDASKKYPVAFLVHGGPQSSFGDQFHYRWNAQTYAARGYAVIMIDFHGSTGYGQAFTDSITQDWGGKPLVDLQKGLAAAYAKYPWMDQARACALGGSYGGYMMSWMASQWADPFKCFVNHAGIVDRTAMAFTTEELWFDEWENGGSPWDAGVADKMAKDDPIRFVSKWKTPTLVTHGERDYRVPYTQGIAIFTALQRQNVPSKLLIFPDENHWILKPANSVQWHAEVLDWLDMWTR
jgi:dipeptidyl aminopeptidase/acylaminoacyl peptidase